MHMHSAQRTYRWGSSPRSGTPMCPAPRAPSAWTSWLTSGPPPCPSLLCCSVCRLYCTQWRVLCAHYRMSTIYFGIFRPCWDLQLLTILRTLWWPDRYLHFHLYLLFHLNIRKGFQKIHVESVMFFNFFLFYSFWHLADNDTYFSHFFLAKAKQNFQGACDHFLVSATELLERVWSYCMELLAISSMT